MRAFHLRPWWGASSPAAAPPLGPAAPVTGALARRAVALALVALGLAVLSKQALVRGLEASTAASVARVLGLLPARAVGSAVVFPLRGRYVGYAVTEGCTVAFLVAPFCLVAGGLIASRRTPPRRGISALVVVTAVFGIVNQLRLFVVAASIRAWGFRSGYERGHVFLGTVLSTIGAVGGLLLFVWLVVRETGPAPAYDHPPPAGPDAA